MARTWLTLQSSGPTWKISFLHEKMLKIGLTTDYLDYDGTSLSLLENV